MPSARVDLVGPVLCALRRADPALWRETVRAAIVAADGNLEHAAERLEITRRALNRWLAADKTLTQGIELRGPGRYPPPTR